MALGGAGWLASHISSPAAVFHDTRWPPWVHSVMLAPLVWVASTRPCPPRSGHEAVVVTLPIRTAPVTFSCKTKSQIVGTVAGRRQSDFGYLHEGAFDSVNAGRTLRASQAGDNIESDRDQVNIDRLR